MTKTNRTIILLLTTIIQFSLFGQQTPAPPQTQPIVVMGATAHLGNGDVIENSVVAFENGKFTLINTTAVSQSFEGYKIIEASGKHIYPAFIAPNTQLGLKEIGAVRATRDEQEVGSLNPSLRSIIAYNTDSKVTPTVRSNGILLAQIVPQGGRISGQSSIVELDAWNYEDATFQADDGIHLRWPRMFKFSGWWAAPEPAKKNENYDKDIRSIKEFLDATKASLSKDNAGVPNLKLAAMHGLFDGSKKLYVHTNAAKTIQEAVLTLKDYGITPVIVGGRDSWQLTDFLKTHDVAVILKDVHSLPSREDADIDQPFKTPAILQDAGILFCFSMNGYYVQRNLPFQAGHAVGFGLDYEKAVSGLTLNTAKILGIDKRIGSVETGKDASFFICAGDALDMRTCKVEQAFIQGKEIDLDNKQKALYRKFQEKYKGTGNK